MMITASSNWYGASGAATKTQVPASAPAVAHTGIIQKRFKTGPSGPLVTSVTVTVASVGSSTVMIAVRMSTTIASTGVAMKGKPNPKAPWMNPASTIASVNHTRTATG